MAEPLEKHSLAGVQARREGRLAAAAEHYAAALAASREHGEKAQVANVARHLGDIHRENGLNSEAKPLLEEALEIYRSRPDTKVLDFANALRPLALLHDSMGDHRSAQALWQEARTLYAAVRVMDGVRECDGHLDVSAGR